MSVKLDRTTNQYVVTVRHDETAKLAYLHSLDPVPTYEVGLVGYPWDGGDRGCTIWRLNAAQYDDYTSA